jgi:hypothetical protein
MTKFAITLPEEMVPMAALIVRGLECDFVRIGYVQEGNLIRMICKTATTFAEIKPKIMHKMPFYCVMKGKHHWFAMPFVEEILKPPQRH